MAAVLGNNPFRINEWRVDPDLNRLSRGELTIKVDPQNMKVLELLASRPGEVFSSTEIEESAWPDVVVSPNSVYQSIAHLRRALGDDKKEPRFIETISKKGYRCVGRVERIEFPKFVEAPKNDSLRAPASAAKRLNWSLRAIGAAAACLSALGLALFLATSSPTESTKAADAGNDPPDLTAEILLRKGDAALIAGHPHEAAREFERAMTLARSSTGEESELTARAMAKLADAFLWQGMFREAERLASEAVRIFETSTPPMDPRQLNARTVLGEVLINLEDYPRADVHLVKAVELGEQLYGRSDRRVGGIIGTLAKLRRAEGRLQEAEELARELVNDV